MYVCIYNMRFLGSIGGGLAPGGVLAGARNSFEHQLNQEAIKCTIEGRETKNVIDFCSCVTCVGGREIDNQ